MDFKEIQELIRLVNKSGLTEFKMRKDDFKIVIRTKHFGKGQEIPEIAVAQPSVVPAIISSPVTPTPAVAPTPTPDLQPSEPKAPPESTQLLTIKSPIVGTFYRSSGPEKPPFKKVGDMVSEGDVVCIVEAMKLFNEIESEVSGKIVKVLIEDASPVEYDQPLFLVDPKG